MGEFSLRVIVIRMEFYRNNAKDPVATRLNHELHEEDWYLLANSAIDYRARAMENMRETQMLKVIAARSASNPQRSQV